AAEPLQVGGEGLGQQLQRNVAAELGVSSAVDFSHPSRAYRGSDPVVGEAAADQLGPPRNHLVGYGSLATKYGDSTVRGRGRGTLCGTSPRAARERRQSLSAETVQLGPERPGLVLVEASG